MKTIVKYSSSVLILQILFTLSTFAQNPAYTLFNENGKEMKYKKMVQQCGEADVVLFGELHNNPISHWLQLELTQDLFEVKGSELVLGAEMFESDNQLIMDEYFSEIISQGKFEEETRLWKNYKTDYKPLLEFAKDSGLRFVATNIPRRYASLVFKHGMDTLDILSDEAKSYIAPLPVIYDTTLNCYSSLAKASPIGGHGSGRMRDAQAIKDATMSHFLLENYQKGNLFIHFNGAYHSDDFESISYFLKKEIQDVKIVTISTVTQNDVSELEEENKGKADFIICVPENMTTTY